MGFSPSNGPCACSAACQDAAPETCACCLLQLARDNVDSDLFGESYQGFGGFSPCDATVTTIKRETFKMLDAAHRADLVRLTACMLLKRNTHAAYMQPHLLVGAGGLCRQAKLVCHISPAVAQAGHCRLSCPGSRLRCRVQGWAHCQMQSQPRPSPSHCTSRCLSQITGCWTCC